MARDGYSALPHSRRESMLPAAEMDMAFESDDEDQHMDTTPLTRQLSASRLDSTLPTNAQSATTYDFERDYDYPPPGSPPGPPPRTLSDAIENSNGILPSPSSVPRPNEMNSAARSSFLRRAVGALLPQHYTRVPTSDNPGGPPRGSGIENDGVFSNVVATPTRPRTVETEDGIHEMPEDSQKDAPPPYAVAQADAVPAYWETTIHAPSYGLGEDPMIDGLPAGTIFSFAWNFLISISFQFVGFMLTYLLHTSHAAKYGSRAGLGVTLIQYGLYSRDSEEGAGFVEDAGGEFGATTDFSARSTGFARRGYQFLSRRNWSSFMSSGDPVSGDSMMQNSYMMSSAHDWLSFLLMTIGWFLLLSSVLGFARVKRWEHGIRSSSTPEAPPSPEAIARDSQVRSHLQRVFGLGIGSDEEEEEEAPTAAADGRTETVSPEENNIRRDLRAMGLI